MMLITLIKSYRESHKLSLRSMAKVTGLSYVTLHRLEKGRPIMSDEWSKLWQWMLRKEEK